jgi:uncharacterized protein (DUF362 family)
LFCDISFNEVTSDRKASGVLGGIGRFIARGDVVVIKPNVAWDRTPEQAANTNPEVVAEAVKLCREAGAREVIVTDATINEPGRCFDRSGIGTAARSEGARVILPETRQFIEVDQHGEVLDRWPVIQSFSGVACVSTGRHFIGTELDAGVAAAARARVAAYRKARRTDG